MPRTGRSTGVGGVRPGGEESAAMRPGPGRVRAGAAYATAGPRGAAGRGHDRGTRPPFLTGRSCLGELRERQVKPWARACSRIEKPTA